MNYRLLFSSALIGLLMSCSEDNQQEETMVSGTFNDINTFNVSPAELYTQKGKIINQEEIAFFVNRKGLSNSFFVNGVTKLQKDIDYTLLVREDHTAELKRDQPGSSFRASISNLQDRRFIITGTDSITSLVGSAGTPLGYVSNPYSVSTCGTNLQIGSLTPSKRCVPIPNFGGAYTERCTYLPIAFIEVENANTLFIPTLSYYFTQGHGSQRCTFGLNNSWNVLNSEFYKQLASGDTVLVQKKQIILKKST